tara:strand:- start:79 stop:318 length:240 start_codon:yes stop_codon:yes gene_type:complete
MENQPEEIQQNFYVWSHIKSMFFQNLMALAILLKNFINFFLLMIAILEHVFRARPVAATICILIERKMAELNQFLIKLS